MQQFLMDLKEKRNEIEEIFTQFQQKINGVESLLDIIISDERMRTILSKINLESEFKEITDTITDLLPDSCGLRQVNMSRANKLFSIKMFVKSISKDDQVDNLTNPTIFHPPVEKGQMIYVDFAGIGGELNSVHYAIVWSATDVMDCIQIIPVKSDKIFYKEFEHCFSIGKAGHLAKETWVDVREITTISRKRINTTLLESTFGAGDNAEVYLDPSQESRIDDAMKVYWGKQRTLLSFLLNNNKSQLPVVRDFSSQSNHFLRPVQFIKTNSSRTVSEYKLIDDSTIYYIDWRNPTTGLTQSQRNREVRAFAYPVSTNVSGHRKSRERVRTDQYNRFQIL